MAIFKNSESNCSNLLSVVYCADHLRGHFELTLDVYKSVSNTCQSPVVFIPDGWKHSKLHPKKKLNIYKTLTFLQGKLIDKDNSY